MIAKDSVCMACHEEIVLVLPWYANGSLGLAERGAVAEHLRSCDECRRELADFQLLQDRWRHAQVDPETESGFARLMAQIDAAERPDARPATVHESVPAPDGSAARSSGLRRRFSG